MKAPDEIGFGDPFADAPLDAQGREALAILEPPPEEHERWRRRVRSVIANLDLLQCIGEFELFYTTTPGKKWLERRNEALRRLQAIDAEVPDADGFFEVNASAIGRDLEKATAMLGRSRPRPRGRPPNRAADDAAMFARRLLEERGFAVTTEREGKYHRLTQVLAGSRRNLIHHLEAALAEKY